MLYRECEVCGERLNLLALESSGEDNDYVMCKCPKCETKYKTSKVNKKKIYISTIPLAIICVLAYILFNQYVDHIDPFYAKAIIACVVSIPIVIIFANHLKNLKFEKIDESDTRNTNEQSFQHSK